MAARSRRVMGLLVAVALALPLVAAPVAAAGESPTAPGVRTHEFSAAEDQIEREVPSVPNASHVPPGRAPAPAPLPVTSRVRRDVGFAGLDLRSTRLANGGRQFTTEPPDQALCTDGRQVLEATNNVMAVFTTSGTKTSDDQALVPFFNHGIPEIVRPDSPSGRFYYGPFMSDPKCYWDPGVRRWFLSELQIETDPATGALQAESTLRLAVSRTSTVSTSPRSWWLYSLRIRNDGVGGTPRHVGCPCFGDQPLLGADAHGLFVTTNEFPLSTAGFNGAQVYAFDKAALTRGTMRVQRLEQDRRTLAEGPAYSLQPATSPSPSAWSSSSRGTEWLMSALDFEGTLDDRIAVWSLTNTRSLGTSHPAVVLRKHVIENVQVYGAPPPATQRPGPTPLADAVNASLAALSSNDDRMNQVVWDGHRLWGAVNTVVRQSGGNAVGIAWWALAPSSTPLGPTATVAKQGYVSVAGEHVMYPSIGVNAAGRGAMTFTLVGPSRYPSAAFVTLDPARGVTSAVQVTGAGRRPDDSFAAYPAYGGSGVDRWGDYSAAVADPAGHVWLAQEWIPGTFGYAGFADSAANGFLANWGTYLTRVTP